MGEKEGKAGKRDKKKEENKLVSFLHGVTAGEFLNLLYNIKQFIL